MNAEELLRHYERVADSPEAVPRLRQLILELAMRGKLLPQNSDEGSQVEALACARRELTDLARTKGRLRFAPSAPIDQSELRSDLPVGWIPARVNDTGLYINGLAFKATDWKPAGLPIIRIQNLTDESREFNFAQGDFPDEVVVRTGDILVSWSATLDAFRWSRERGVLNQHIFRVIPATGLTSNAFLLLLLKRAIREMADSDHAHGLVMTHINRGPFLNHVVWIPPLAEQHRIVAKVDELMALCDRLEAARTGREAARDRLTAASMARLNTPNPETFEADARFALDALPDLTARSDLVGQLRQALVGLAVRGRLLPQLSSDESAEHALRRLLEHKQTLIAKKQVRQGKVSQPADSEDASTELPEGWVWARVDDLCFKVTDGTHFTPKYTSTGVRFVSAKDIVEGNLTFERCKFISPEEHKDLYRRCNPEWHDIVISKSGSIGSVALVEDRGEFSLFESLALLKFDQATINPRFLVYALRHACASLKAGHLRGIGVKHLHLDVLRGLTLALPPNDEQGRIVAKLDELMALCGQLEAALTAGEAHRRGLLESLLHEALEPDAEEEEVV